jgi:hypothetical protein
VKKWVLSWFVTPKRVRKVVAGVVSWLIYRAIVRGTWDMVLEVARWMRRLADFLESWDAADLPADKDKLIADLVGSAITDEAVDKLVERIAAMKAERLAVLRGRQVGGSVVLPELPASETIDV